MFAICIEASHKKGMGHLFRMLNFIEVLKEKNERFIFFINNDEKVKEIIAEKRIPFEIIDLKDSKINWESNLIEKYKIKYWINDRLDTDINHAKNVLTQNIKLITFDDLGEGSKLSDINICGLFFNKGKLKGKRILSGISYLILNSEIIQLKRKRKKLKKILVSLGGSDTYSVTIKVLEILKKYKIKASIHIGPNFKDIMLLKEKMTIDYDLIDFVPSLVEELSKYDLAITGGGITPFEANASGLPCLIIANEVFEIENAKFLQNLGSSSYLGFYKDFDIEVFSDLLNLNIEEMSIKGLQNFEFNAKNKIYEEIIKI